MQLTGHFVRAGLVAAENTVKRESLSEEKTKLEKMIINFFDYGGSNMGKDFGILRQSKLVDKLIVETMMLDEHRENYIER